MYAANAAAAFLFFTVAPFELVYCFNKFCGECNCFFACQ